MELVWQVNESDIQKTKQFFNQHRDTPFVKNRINRNVNKAIPKITKDVFWDAMISCLLTTQQRSGPKSAVTKFISSKPFPLNYPLCFSQQNLKVFVENTITNFGAIRRGKTIGEESSRNYEWLNNGGWNKVFKIIGDLKNNPSRETERKSVEVIIDNLRGFGPKQSRNMLQSLGLTRFEIPIDSRITKWLNKFGFPVALSATALSDKNYYNFVSDGFQKICESSGIYPCALDAAIFSSFDEDEWSEDNLVW